MKKQKKTIINETSKRDINVGIRYKFGKERRGIFRRIRNFFAHVIKPETSVDDGSLWLMFREKEHKAMQIVKSVADVIEMDYTRVQGEEFLTAFSTVIHACTPDCINKIFKMMFRRPVFFDRSISMDVIRWLVSIPSVLDKNITLSISPIKVEYLSEFCIRANLLTESGPYISANFTTTQDQGSTNAETAGTFQIYTPADSVFNEEWALPGVMRYSVTVTISYVENTNIGLNTSLLMEIARRCVEDVLCGKSLWCGYFGEDRPLSCKKGFFYYKAVIGYVYPEFFDRVEDMIQVKRKTTTVKVEEYSANPGADVNFTCDNSNFEISSDSTDVSSPEKPFIITIYPPLEDRQKKSAVSTTVDVHRGNYSNNNQFQEDSMERTSEDEIEKFDEPD